MTEIEEKFKQLEAEHKKTLELVQATTELNGKLGVQIRTLREALLAGDALIRAMDANPGTWPTDDETAAAEKYNKYSELIETLKPKGPTA